MSDHTTMQSPRLSLQDLVGQAYTDAVCRARAFVTGADYDDLAAIAAAPVDFAPPSYQTRLDELVDVIGDQVCDKPPQLRARCGDGCLRRSDQDGDGAPDGLRLYPRRRGWPGLPRLQERTLPRLVGAQLPRLSVAGPRDAPRHPQRDAQQHPRAHHAAPGGATGPRGQWHRGGRQAGPRPGSEHLRAARPEPRHQPGDRQPRRRGRP